MGIMSKLFILVQKLNSVSDQPISQDMYAFADSAYQYYIGAFGPPKDTEKKFEILMAPIACMAYDPIQRLYILTFREHDQNMPQAFASVAHEMYHRVTSRRKGLNKHLWVDEMLASLATYKFLCENEFTEFAEANLKLCYAQRNRLDIGLSHLTHVA